MKKLEDLTDGGRQELALALLLWKDFKSDGHMDIEIYKQALELTEMLGVRREFEELIRKLPAFKITAK